MNGKKSIRKKCVVCGRIFGEENRVTCSRECSRKYSYPGTKRKKRFLNKK